MVYLYRHNVHSPSIMKVSRKLTGFKAGFTLIELMVVVAILAALGSIAYPAIMDRMNDGDRQVASSNLKQIHTMLQQFQQDRGSFPCDATAEELQEVSPDINFGELTGDISNPYFRQLLMTQQEPSEKNFYAKLSGGGKMTKEGDGKYANGKALERGENGMGYVMLKSKDDESKKNSVSKTTAPLAICALYPSRTPYQGDAITFDRKSFRAHAFVLFVDGSVKDQEKNLQEDDDDEEKATFKQGVDIFPETKKGRATAGDYIVLTPEL